MISIRKGERGSKGTVTVAGVSIDWRVIWDADYQEYACNVKAAGAQKWNKDTEYFTNDWDDAQGTLELMANTCAANHAKRLIAG